VAFFYAPETKAVFCQMKRLIFMVRPILDKWIKPFGVFDSSGAASCDDLYSLVIIRLEVRLFSTVSDGVSSNNVGSSPKWEY
jgi:hypothetical protein